MLRSVRRFGLQTGLIYENIRDVPRKVSNEDKNLIADI